MPNTNRSVRDALQQVLDNTRFAALPSDALDRLKDDVLSTIGHELRTPLTSMRGSLALLDGGTLGAVDPRAKRILGIALANTERLARLVEDVLDLFNDASVPVEVAPLPRTGAAALRKRVLVVDDDDDIREITAASLELTRGWIIATATRGSEAIREAATLRPDAILLDVMMPDMDGPTAFRILRSNPETEHIPVILLTARTRTNDRDQYTRLGVEGVIAKPFDPFTLADRVAATLRWE